MGETASATSISLPSPLFSRTVSSVDNLAFLWSFDMIFGYLVESDRAEASMEIEPDR